MCLNDVAERQEKKYCIEHSLNSTIHYKFWLPSFCLTDKCNVHTLIYGHAFVCPIVLTYLIQITHILQPYVYINSITHYTERKIAIVGK